MVPANVNEKFVIRFCVCAQNATDEDIGEFGIGAASDKSNFDAGLKILTLKDVKMVFS